MEIFYHGSSILFRRFDLSHALEGDGKVKFGYGIYVTSCYRSAAHYAGTSQQTGCRYVYTVEVPDIREDNHIAFNKAVHKDIIEKAELKLGVTFPKGITENGKDFRKYLAQRLTGKADLNGEKAASAFLDSIGVEMITWPYNWKNPASGSNRAILNDQRISIVKIEQVDLNNNKQFIEGSARIINI